MSGPFVLVGALAEFELAQQTDPAGTGARPPDGIALSHGCGWTVWVADESPLPAQKLADHLRTCLGTYTEVGER